MIKIENISYVSNIYSSVNSAIEITSGICNLIAINFESNYTNNGMTLSVSFDVWMYRWYVMALFSSHTMHKRETRTFCTYILLLARRIKQIVRFQFDFAFDRRRTRFRYRRIWWFRAQKYTVLFSLSSFFGAYYRYSFTIHLLYYLSYIFLLYMFVIYV